MCDESLCSVLGVEAILATRKAEAAAAAALEARKAKAMDIVQAAYDGRMADVQLVCKYAPEKVNDQDYGGDTALHWAAAKNSLEMAELLLASNAAVDIQNYGRKTPIQRAQVNRNGQQMVALLQQHQQ